MKQFKAALFDLDGTLFDTEGQYSVFWKATGEKYRPDVPNLSDVIKGTTLVQIFNNYFPHKQWQEEITEGLDRWEENMDFPFIPGAQEFIRNIREHGVKCAVVTSSNRKKMDALRRKLPTFPDMFDVILTSEDFSASKPAPDCYIKAASVLGCSRDECVVFEDAFTGLQAGMSAEIFTVGLATYNSADAIKDKCNYVIQNFCGIGYDDVVRMLNHDVL